MEKYELKVTGDLCVDHKYADAIILASDEYPTRVIIRLQTGQELHIAAALLTVYVSLIEGEKED